MDDKSIQRAREQIYDAVRFLAPDEAHRILKEAADSTKKLADKYDRLLQEALS